MAGIAHTPSSGSAAYTASIAVIPLSGTTVTATQVPGVTSKAVIDGHTIALGSGGVTVHGEVISLGSAGLFDASTTVAYMPVSDEQQQQQHQQQAPLVAARDAAAPGDPHSSLIVSTANPLVSSYLSGPPVTPTTSIPFATDPSHASNPSPVTESLPRGSGPGLVSLSSSTSAIAESTLPAPVTESGPRISRSHARTTTAMSAATSSSAPASTSAASNSVSSQAATTGGSASASSSTGSSAAPASPRRLGAGSVAVLAAGLLGVFGAMVML